MPVDENEAIRASLTKNLGKAAFDNPTITGWQKTGSLILDQIIRRWKYPKADEAGLPMGKWVDVYGRPSGGKTSFCCRVGAACQAEGGLVIYINTSEQGFNPLYAQQLGLNTDSDNFMLVNAFSLESCFQAIEDFIRDYHDREQATVIIIDSVSGLGCNDYSMDESKVKDNTPSAANAKFLHNWFRRGVLFYQSGSKITVLCIRHQTDSPRMFAPEAVTHGSAINFYSWIRIKVKSTDMEAKESGKKVGKWLTLEVTRNKVSGNIGVQMQMPLYYGRGFDEGVELLHHLEGIGVLPQTRGKVVWNATSVTVKELVKMYHDDSVTRGAIRQLVLDNTDKVFKAKRGGE